MASVKTLTLTATRQAVVIESFCDYVLIKEDPLVGGGISKQILPSATLTGAQDHYNVGGIAPFYPPGKAQFSPGQIAGYIAVDSGSTTGIQTEVGGPQV